MPPKRHSVKRQGFGPGAYKMIGVGIVRRVRLTCNQGHGNANISPHGKPAHGHHRSSPERGISCRQRALDSNAPGLDKAPANPASPRRTLRLLRSGRSLGPHPHQAKGAGAGLKSTPRPLAGKTTRVCRFLLLDHRLGAAISSRDQNGRLSDDRPLGSPRTRTSSSVMKTEPGLRLAR